MKTFLLDDGDLSLASGAFEMATGQTKLRQDLGYALREPLGIDRFHPRWGSVLPSFIGSTITGDVGAEVSAEARRVLDNYLTVQRDRITRDKARGNRPRYGSAEVIDRIKGVQVRQDLDRIHLRCVLSTLSADEVVLVTTVGA